MSNILDSFTMVTISTEDGDICLLRSSMVRSQTNALTWDSVKSLCFCNNNRMHHCHGYSAATKTELLYNCALVFYWSNRRNICNQTSFHMKSAIKCRKNHTLTKLTAFGEKSQAWTKMFGYVATSGKIVFPAPHPTCISRPIIR